MSKDNVEIVSAIYQAWADGRSAAPFIHKDLEYVNPPDAIETGTKIGRGHLNSVRDVFPDTRFEVERYIDAGDDVVVIAKMIGRGSSSGALTERRQSFIWTVADGQAVRFRWFNESAEALAALGLSE